MNTSGELQLLSFTLGEDIYAIDISKVQEIRAVGQVRNLPNMPGHCIGVIDFRSHIVPVLDLRDLFHYDDLVIRSQTVMIVVTVMYEESPILVGIVVDSVSDVMMINETDLKSAPSFGSKVDVSFVQGMFKKEELIIVMLALDSVFGAEEFKQIREMAKQVAEST
jgi:purine-binding chemotaxis protein CheW